MTTNQFFNEELYLAQNPEVADSVTSGKYASGYDEFIEVGQFVERNGVIFNGTNGNDTVQASGQKSSVIGATTKLQRIKCSTTACKAIAWNKEGKAAAEGRAQYGLLQPQEKECL